MATDNLERGIVQMEWCGKIGGWAFLTHTCQHCRYYSQLHHRCGRWLGRMAAYRHCDCPLEARKWTGREDQSASQCMVCGRRYRADGTCVDMFEESTRASTAAPASTQGAATTVEEAFALAPPGVGLSFRVPFVCTACGRVTYIRLQDVKQGKTTCNECTKRLRRARAAARRKARQQSKTCTESRSEFDE